MTLPGPFLAICHQIAGGRAIGPVIRHIRFLGFGCEAVAYGVSATALREQDLEYRDATKLDLPHDVLSAAAALLDEVKPSVVLTGTSAGMNLEKAVLSEARRRGIPTIAVLDHWSNYEARFSDEESKTAFFPDVLCVMDEIALDDLRRRGFPEAQMAITGQPYFDDLASASDPTTRTRVREDLNVGSEERVLVFASEPHSRDHGQALGYTETDALEVLLQAVEKCSSRERWKIVVRPHPTESPRDLLRMAEGRRLNVVQSPDIGPRDLIIAADVVVGMTSMFLIESALLRTATISLQPNLRGDDQFIGRRLGLVRSVYDEIGLLDALNDLQQGRRDFESGLTAGLRLDGHSAERVSRIVIDRLSAVRRESN